MKYLVLFILSSFFIISCKKEPKESISSKPLEVSNNEIVNYIKYCNDRFDVCFEYPSNFGALPEPANGDGRTFSNEPDAAQIIFFGFLDQSNEGLNAQLMLSQDLINIKRIDTLKNGYEITGIDKETKRLHYEKILTKPSVSPSNDSVNIIYSLQFVYPKNKNDKYKSYWKKLSGKFN